MGVARADLLLRHCDISGSRPSSLKFREARAFPSPFDEVKLGFLQQLNVVRYLQRNGAACN